jgi:iron(II)-dependent oxidoreductase
VCKVNPKTIINCPGVGDGKCAENQCNKTTGACELQSKPDTTPCDDGNSCTAPGTCVGGACQNEANLCGCKLDADCADQDDNNLCNGVYYCDKTSGKCLVNPATVVSCATGDDTACQKNLCDPTSGQCSLKNVNEGKLCDADGTACTPVDECVQGQCVQGTNICTCKADSDCASKEDGNLCNGTLYCDKTVEPATCKVNPATVKTCPNVDDTTCETNICDPKTGNCQVSQKPDNAKCSDGVDCTIGDVCTAGSCSAGTNVCTCDSNDDCPDDNDLCNGVPFCDKSAAPFACKTNPATVVTCTPGGVGCVITACDKHTGKCGPAAGDCDDKNPCTVDACDVQTGQCSHADLVDASPCSGGVCVAGSCKPVAQAEVAVAGGVLQMGCNAASGCSSDELPVHPVSVDTFAIDRFEVTVADYGACVTSGNCTAPAGSDADCNWGKDGKATHPVTCVSWPQAQAYCQFAAKRLPTEAEWEAAARGLCGLSPSCASQTPLYPWGNDTPTCSWAVMVGDSGPGCDLGTTKGVGVMSTDRSPYQVRDMGGNAREWTADWYDASYYAASPGGNPAGPATGTQRVARGGSWQATTAQMRSTSRHPLLPATATVDLGFRCARSLTAP